MWGVQNHYQICPRRVVRVKLGVFSQTNALEDIHIYLRVYCRLVVGKRGQTFLPLPLPHHTSETACGDPSVNCYSLVFVHSINQITHFGSRKTKTKGGDDFLHILEISSCTIYRNLILSLIQSNGNSHRAESVGSVKSDADAVRNHIS